MIYRKHIQLDSRRCFSPAQRAEMFLRSNGKCDMCSVKITGDWTAGHVLAWSLGGKTEIENGRVECPDCAKETHVDDTGTAAKCERMAGRKGQYARRKKNGSQFPKLTKEQRKEKYKARKAWVEKVRRK